MADETTRALASGYDAPLRTDIVLSVVVPVFNERATLPRVLANVARALPGITKEIIVVDDCSRDGTREWLTEAFPRPDVPLVGVRTNRDGGFHFMSEDDTCGAGPDGEYEAVAGPTSIRVAMHAQNGGKGRALRTGFAASAGDIIVVQDADLEYDPADWKEMLALMQRGVADVVYGSRFYGRPHRTLYMYHYLGNRTISFLFNILFDQTLTDVETGYKMFRREVLEGVELVSDDFGIEIELSAAFARPKRWRIYELGISYYGRTYDEGKKIGWKDGLLALWYVLKYRLRSPVRDA